MVRAIRDASDPRAAATALFDAVDPAARESRQSDGRLRAQEGRAAEASLRREGGRAGGRPSRRPPLSRRERRHRPLRDLRGEDGTTLRAEGTQRRGPGSNRWRRESDPGRSRSPPSSRRCWPSRSQSRAYFSIAGVEAGDPLHDRRPSCFSRSSSGHGGRPVAARYWAVLGLHVLVLMMLASAFGLVLVSSVLEAVGTTCSYSDPRRSSTS